MPDRSRVPVKIRPFNSYITSTASYIAAGSPANGLRLGLTGDNIANWMGNKTQWENLYGQYNNPVENTSIVKSNVRGFMRHFRAFARPLLNIIAASPAANENVAAVFNLVLDARRKKPTYAVTPITDSVMAEARPRGGGGLQVACRTHGAKRTRKHPHADMVQVAIKIGGAPPAHANDGTYKEIFTRARFILDLGTENEGKKIYLHFRWHNSKHPRLSGPWGDLISLSLS